MRNNNLVLEADSLCSKRYAVIERDLDGRFTVYDLGSTNGTKVNGEAVDNRTLCDGDEIQVGQTRLRFQLARSIELEESDLRRRNPIESVPSSDTDGSI